MFDVYHQVWCCLCLLSRSLDICLDNELERIHALRLIRRVAQLLPHQFPTVMLHSLVAIVNDGMKESDKMTRICLATLCELGLFYLKCL